MCVTESSKKERERGREREKEREAGRDRRGDKKEEREIRKMHGREGKEDYKGVIGEGGKYCRAGQGSTKRTKEGWREERKLLG